MGKQSISRRTVLAAGASVLAASAGIASRADARADTGLSSSNEQLIRKYYAAWEQKDWHPIDVLLADDFTFSSAYGDDHISKSDFKTNCWQSQIDFTDHFDLKQLIANGNVAFVLYVCTTKNGKTFRNVEYIRLKDGKIESIECYFGGKASFPSAVSTGHT